MKGNAKLLRTLNRLLAEELTAINQYIVHSEMCANWGFERLHQKVEKRAIEEMKHAERLISRIIFLEGSPEVSKLNKMHIGANVKAQLSEDLKAEVEAVKEYNGAIQEAAQVGDNGSRELLEEILEDEEAHVDWLEAQLDQIEQCGIENYLANQAKEEK